MILSATFGKTRAAGASGAGEGVGAGSVASVQATRASAVMQAAAQPSSVAVSRRSLFVVVCIPSIPSQDRRAGSCLLCVVLLRDRVVEVDRRPGQRYWRRLRSIPVDH